MGDTLRFLQDPQGRFFTELLHERWQFMASLELLKKRRVTQFAIPPLEASRMSHLLRIALTI